jgi:hypothetical protein
MTVTCSSPASTLRWPSAYDVVIEPMTGLLDGMRSMNLGSVKRKGKHGSANLILNEQ